MQEVDRKTYGETVIVIHRTNDAGDHEYVVREGIRTVRTFSNAKDAEALAKALA